MSSNAVAAMAVILVSGFAGCAATARAADATVSAQPSPAASHPAGEARRAAPAPWRGAGVFVRGHGANVPADGCVHFTTA